MPQFQKLSNVTSTKFMVKLAQKTIGYSRPETFLLELVFARFAFCSPYQNIRGNRKKVVFALLIQITIILFTKYIFNCHDLQWSIHINTLTHYA